MPRSHIGHCTIMGSAKRTSFTVARGCGLLRSFASGGGEELFALRALLILMSLGDVVTARAYWDMIAAPQRRGDGQRRGPVRHLAPRSRRVEQSRVMAFRAHRVDACPAAR
eukprot:NODE_12112_length_1245_cov_6.876565.p3 GENE.NODE_12112_length_1245_cov_6.876565~~NODE_12112_length_1245_cov_6.876565.p3  ORF type:complete len:111 (-),score=14.97 NODE_12112_length_1245_cov_6.876565:386-718(-)